MQQKRTGCSSPVLPGIRIFGAHYTRRMRHALDADAHSPRARVSPGAGPEQVGAERR